MRHLTIGQTLSIKRNGGLVDVAKLHNAMLASGISSHFIYVEWANSIPAPQSSTGLKVALNNPFFFGIHAAAAIKKAIQEADVVHVHGLYTYLNYLAGKYCHQYRKPLIYHPHGALVPEYLRSGRLKKAIVLRLFERRNFQRMAAWRALTSAEAEQIRDYVPDARVFVVPNGVAVDQELPPLINEHSRLALTAIRSKRTFLFLSRISAVKGLDLLLDAWHGSPELSQNCELWIAGMDSDGTERMLRKQIRTHKIRGIRLIGSVSENEKQWLFRAADIFVLPSRGEGQSPAVLEAMIHCKPVLLTSTCFFPEARSVCAGIECSSNIDSVREGLIKFARIPKLELKSMGQNGRALVAERYDIRRVAIELDAQVSALVS